MNKKKKCRTLNSLSSRGPCANCSIHHHVPLDLFRRHFNRTSFFFSSSTLSSLHTRERELYQFLLIGLCRPLPLRCDNSYPGRYHRQIKEHFPFISRVVFFFWVVVVAQGEVVVQDIPFFFLQKSWLSGNSFWFRLFFLRFIISFFSPSGSERGENPPKKKGGR